MSINDSEHLRRIDQAGLRELFAPADYRGGKL
jgi:hypothetical protein